MLLDTMISLNIFWSWLGVAIFYLFMLTRSDFLNKRKLKLDFWGVDERYNYFMSGSVLMLFFITEMSLYLLLGVFIGNIILLKLLNKIMRLADGDIQTLTWWLNGCFLVLYSMGVVWYQFIVPYCIMIFLFCGYAVLKYLKYGLSDDTSDPYMVFIFLGHLFFVLLLFLLV